jgi:hypothetical protein
MCSATLLSRRRRTCIVWGTDLPAFEASLSELFSSRPDLWLPYVFNSLKSRAEAAFCVVGRTEGLRGMPVVC